MVGEMGPGQNSIFQFLHYQRRRPGQTNITSLESVRVCGRAAGQQAALDLVEIKKARFCLKFHRRTSTVHGTRTGQGKAHKRKNSLRSVHLVSAVSPNRPIDGLMAGEGLI